MNKQIFRSSLAALVLLPVLAGISAAQNVNILFVPTNLDPPANFRATGSWVQDDDDMTAALGPPEGRFNEVALIESGGTAFLDTAVASTLGVGGVNIGATSTFQIRDGGSMSFFTDGGNDRRLVSSGTLEFQGSGNLEIENLLLNGSAALNIDFTAGTTTPLSVSDTDIPLSPLGTGGAAALNGTLNLDFSGVASPSGAFTLIDAVSFSGGFAGVTATGLGANQSVGISTVSGGSNGRLLQANVINALTVTVDQSSGVVTLDKTHGSSLTLDGFRIFSANGNLAPDSEVALDTGWSIVGANSPGSIAQLFEGPNVANPTYTVASSSSTSIGSVYSADATEFGNDPFDLTFEYTDPTAGIVQGTVTYTEPLVENNIVLQIDPTTGAGQLANTSRFPQQIEAYRITSADGSLIEGNWSSFDDNNVGGAFGWSEVAGADANTLFEVNEDSTTLFDSVTTDNPSDGFGIGNIFSVGAAEDLVLEFLIAGDDEFTTGKVVYGDLLLGAPAGDGDFDADGDVDGADFLAWQRTDGTADGLLDWQVNYPAAALAASSAASAVPEPTSVALLALSALGLAFLKPRR